MFIALKQRVWIKIYTFSLIVNEDRILTLFSALGYIDRSVFVTDRCKC